ncbi:unnamed protein product [Phaeothamnion confervicola]
MVSRALHFEPSHPRALADFAFLRAVLSPRAMFPSQVQDQLKVAGGGRAIAVQDVHAPPEYVWDRILDFPAYPKMVPKVAACYNYFTQTLRNNTQVIKTRLKLNVFGVKFDNFIYHTYYPSLDSMTWTLDYSRRSTLDDSVGFWYIVPHPQREIKPDWTRVYYSCQLGIPSWVPGIVIGYLNKKAIKEANSWVKKESEALYSKDLASGKMSLQGKKNVLEPPSWLSKGLFSKDGAAERPAWLSKGLFGKALPPPPPVAVEPERGPPGGGVARAAKIGLGAGSCYLAWRLLQQDSDR